jgi:hypothetical protein
MYAAADQTRGQPLPRLEIHPSGKPSSLRDNFYYCKPQIEFQEELVVP